MFRVSNGQVCLAWREYITQVGAVAALILDYGWPIHLIGLDPRDWTFDMAAFDSAAPAAKMVIAGESKRTAAEFRSLLEGVLDAAHSGSEVHQLGSTDAHKNMAGC